MWRADTESDLCWGRVQGLFDRAIADMSAPRLPLVIFWFHHWLSPRLSGHRHDVTIHHTPVRGSLLLVLLPPAKDVYPLSPQRSSVSDFLLVRLRQPQKWRLTPPVSG